MDAVTLFPLGHKIDATVATKYAALVAGASEGSAKYPTAAGEGGFVGFVQETGSADESLLFIKEGISEAIASGLIAKGDYVEIASSAGDVQTANPAPGQTTNIIGIAQGAVVSGESKVDVWICPGTLTGTIYTSAASNPGVNNDGVDTAALGRKFAAGSFWINLTTPALFICMDASTGAADWNTVTQS